MYISRHTLQRLKQVQERIEQLRPDADAEALLVPGSPQQPRGNIIVFTGSFNPPTVAHLALLKQCQRYVHQKVGRQNPMHLYAAFSKVTVNKEQLERPLLRDRILLLQHLLHMRLPHTGMLLFNRGLYVEQAQAIRHSYPSVKHIHFLMGYDKIVQIFDPRYYQDRDMELELLFREAQMLVAPRGDDDEADLQILLAKAENKRFARYIHSIPFDSRYRNISSTAARQRKHSYERAIPREVRLFMQKTRAYSPPMHKKNGDEIDYYEERLQLINKLVNTI